jgi:ribosomal protein L11 methyltransferase
LAIVAGHLEASWVLGLDVDAVAVAAARQNAENNRVRVELRTATVDALTEVFDVVVANVDVRTLMRAANALAAVTSPSGVLLLTGFLVDDEADVLGAFGPSMRCSHAVRVDGWSLLQLRPGVGRQST